MYYMDNLFTIAEHKYKKYKNKYLLQKTQKGGNNCMTNKSDNDCEKKMSILKSIVSPFNNIQTKQQAVWIQQFIGYNTIFKILHDEFYLDITYIEHLSENRYTTMKLDTSNIKTNFILIGYIFKFGNFSHINAILINNSDKTIHIYEPHKNIDLDYYFTQLFSNTIFEQYKRIDLPVYILQQSVLPICYMYVLHFFICTISGLNKQIYIEKQCDDIFIMKFTRDILKLSHEFKYVEDLTYYLLTNNLYKIDKYIEDDMKQFNDDIKYNNNLDSLQLMIDRWNLKINSEEMMSKIYGIEVLRANKTKSNILKQNIEQELLLFQTAKILKLGPSVKIRNKYNFQF